MKADSWIANAVNSAIAAVSTADPSEWADSRIWSRVAVVASSVFALTAVRDYCAGEKQASREEIDVAIVEALRRLESGRQANAAAIARFRDSLQGNLVELAMAVDASQGDINQLMLGQDDLLGRVVDLEKFVREFRSQGSESEPPPQRRQVTKGEGASRRDGERESLPQRHPPTPGFGGTSRGTEVVVSIGELVDFALDHLSLADQNRLHDALKSAYSMADLAVLSERIGIDWENVEGTKKDLKALNLIAEARRHRRLALLAQEIQARQERDARTEVVPAAGRPFPQLSPQAVNIVGSMPADVGPTFKDRMETLAQLREILEERHVKLTCIVGRGGIGKTWVLSKLCGEIEGGRLRLSETATRMGVDGIVYLSLGVESSITLEGLFHRLAGLLGSPRTEEMIALWRDPSVSVRDKARTLLTQMRHGCYLLVLDSFEAVLGPDNTIGKEDWRLFVDDCLSTPHTLRLLVTSRDRVVVMTGIEAAREVVLEGLPEPDAVSLLRELDFDGERRLKRAEESELLEAARRCCCIPRALKAIVGILSQDRTLALKELLSNDSLFNERVVENLVAEQYRRLESAERQVMQALSVCNTPTPMEVIQHILEPFLSASGVRSALNRLVQVYSVVRREGDDGSQTYLYELHPLDRQYAYSKVPGNNPKRLWTVRNSCCGKSTLHLRAADYYTRHVRPKENWKTRQDLENLLAGFWHLVNAGCYDRAYRLLETFSFDYLWLWGYYQEVVHLHEVLEGHLQDRELRHLNKVNLGFAEWSVEHIEKALLLFKEALPLISARKNPRAAAICLGNMGLAYEGLGELPEALHCYGRALSIDHQMGDAKLEGIHLCDQGVALRELGEIHKAIECSTQGYVLSSRSQDFRIMSNHRANLGYCQLLLGNTGGAEGEFLQGYEIAQTIDSAIGVHYSLYGLTFCALLSGDYEKGLQWGTKVDKASGFLGKPHSRLVYGFACLARGDFEGARKALEGAVTRCSTLLEGLNRNWYVLYCQGAALLALGRFDAARIVYKRAQEVCSADGVTKHALLDIRLLKRISSSNPAIDGLDAIEQMLSNKPNDGMLP